jgi:hypothetical protein
VYTALQLACLITFLVLLPVVLVVRALRPELMPWWQVVVLAVALGWIASNIYIYLGSKSFEAFRGEVLNQDPPALVDGWQIPQSVPLLWGWIWGIGYLVVLLGPYQLLRGKRYGTVI